MIGCGKTVALAAAAKSNDVTGAGNPADHRRDVRTERRPSTGPSGESCDTAPQIAEPPEDIGKLSFMD